MTVQKAVFSTSILIVFYQLLSLWQLVELISKDDLDNLEFYYLLDGSIKFLAIVVFLYYINRLDFPDCFVTDLKYYWIAAFLGLLFVFIQTPLNLLYNLLFSTEYHISYEFDVNNVISTRALSTILLIPISEELFFRNYIQAGLKEKMDDISAAFLSALLFSTIHFIFIAIYYPGFSFNSHQVYIAFFGGLISAILFVKARKSGPSIVFHICWNLMSVL